MKSIIGIYCIFYTDYHPIIKYFHTDKQFDFYKFIIVIIQELTHTSFVNYK